MTPLMGLFIEQLVPSVIVWFLVYFALRFRGKIGKLGLMHIVYVMVVAFLGASARQLFGFEIGPSADQASVVRVAVISSLLLPLLFSFGVVIFPVYKSPQ